MSQMLKFARALTAIHAGEEPQDYKAEYLYDLENELAKTVPEWIWNGSNLALEVLGQMAGTRMIEQQQADLRAFGVDFDCWYRESSLHGNGWLLTNVYKNGDLYFENDGNKVCGLCGRYFVDKCEFCNGNLANDTSYPMKSYAERNYTRYELDPQLTRYSEEAVGDPAIDMA